MILLPQLLGRVVAVDPLSDDPFGDSDRYPAVPPAAPTSRELHTVWEYGGYGASEFSTDGEWVDDYPGFIKALTSTLIGAVTTLAVWIFEFVAWLQGTDRVLTLRPLVDVLPTAAPVYVPAPVWCPVDRLTARRTTGPPCSPRLIRRCAVVA